MSEFGASQRFFVDPSGFLVREPQLDPSAILGNLDPEVMANLSSLRSELKVSLPELNDVQRQLTRSHQIARAAFLRAFLPEGPGLAAVDQDSKIYTGWFYYDGYEKGKKTPPRVSAYRTGDIPDTQGYLVRDLGLTARYPPLPYFYFNQAFAEAWAKRFSNSESNPISSVELAKLMKNPRLTGLPNYEELITLWLSPRTFLQQSSELLNDFWDIIGPFKDSPDVAGRGKAAQPHLLPLARHLEATYEIKDRIEASTR